MAKRSDEQDVAYLEAALDGDLGPHVQDEAGTAVMIAIEHGYDDDAAQVAETLRGLLAGEG